jgi:hypothetical protein
MHGAGCTIQHERIPLQVRSVLVWLAATPADPVDRRTCHADASQAHAGDRRGGGNRAFLTPSLPVVSVPVLAVRGSRRSQNRHAKRGAECGLYELEETHICPTVMAMLPL